MQKSYNNIGDFMLEDNITELKLRLTGLKSKTPILLLGNAAKTFINLYKKNITNINSQDDLKMAQDIHYSIIKRKTKKTVKIFLINSSIFN